MSDETGAEATPEELLEQQKANCIFCKIVKNEIPSKRVYEDEKMLALLDIRPAAKGHTLVLPTEHYPIMPLIPPETFSHLFGKSASLSGAVREGMVAERCTTFIANGAVAGQQSPHFLFHLIPREAGDGLDNFTIPTGSVDQQEIAGLLTQNLTAVMRQHLQRYPLTTPNTPPQPHPVAGATGEKATVQAPATRRERATSAESGTAARAETEPATPRSAGQPSIEQLAQIIEQTPELKALLINNPQKLQAILAENPQLQPLFAGVDVQKLGEQLRRQLLGEAAGSGESAEQREMSGETSKEMREAGVKSAEGEKPATTPEDLIPARELTLSQLFAFIEQKPKLKALILDDPERLKAIIPENERLKHFFEGVDVDAIITAYQTHVRKEREEQERGEELDEEDYGEDEERGKGMSGGEDA